MPSEASDIYHKFLYGYLKSTFYQRIGALNLLSKLKIYSKRCALRAPSAVTRLTGHRWSQVRTRLGFGTILHPHLFGTLGSKNRYVWKKIAFTCKKQAHSRKVRWKWCWIACSKCSRKICASRYLVTYTIEKSQKITKNDEKWKFLFSFENASEVFKN